MIETHSSAGYRHFRCEIDAQGIAWLTLDCADSAVNRLSGEVLREFSRVLDEFGQKPPVGLIVRSGKDNGFIAGADIDEFAGLATADQAMALVARGWKLFNRLARLPYPTLALIHGHCLGGGLELALACRYRLVVDRPGTSLALPEVMLGIVPAWGGMLRLPALIGPMAALDMMLTGRAVDAHRAQRLGLADGLVAPRLMDRAAAMLVASRRPRRRPAGMLRLLNLQALRPLVARMADRKIAARDPYRHYPAPRAILEIWSRHKGNALEAPDLVDSLIRSDTASNLVRLFHLRERLKAFGKAGRRQQLRHVHVVGAGVMGGDIAAWCALKGMTVTLQDQDRARIAQAQGRAHALFARKMKSSHMARAAADRLLPDPQGHGVRRADLVIEAIYEDLDAKRALYAQIAPRMKAAAVLATNTSSLPLEALRSGLPRPGRLIGLHFFNPVDRMPLLEVVSAEGVDEDAFAVGLAFAGRIGKLPLPVQSSPGFLVNAVLAPYLLEAMRCIDEGMAPETVDEAMLAFGMPMGPIELADTVGLDIVRDAGRRLAGQAGVPTRLQAHLAGNELGRKTGRGFYVWKDGKPVKRSSFPPAPPGLAHRLIRPLLDKAQERLDSGVVADADLVDAGIVFGTGFAPFTGGPLHYQRSRRTLSGPLDSTAPST